MSANLFVVNRQRRRGLTLVELVVVMLILAALAGIVIAVMPNFLGQAHSSTSAGNATEILNLVQTHQNHFGRAPDRLDSLVVPAGTLIDYLPFDNTGGDLVAVEVASDDDAEIIEHAFEKVGIENLMYHAVTPTNATFENYDATTPQTTLAAGYIVEITDPTIVPDVDLVNNFPNTTRFFVFGLGSACTAIGKSMAQAPVHFPDEGSINEDYNRFLLLYAVNTAQDEPSAQLVSVLSVHEDSLPGIGSHLSEYHNSRQ